MIYTPVRVGITLVLIPLTLVACSQHHPSKLSRDIKINQTATAVEHLSSNIMVIYQDHSHHLWMGSWQDGLYRYDGKQIDHFTSTEGLAAKRIEEIKEDQNGKIYINTDQGLFRWDDSTFTHLYPQKTPLFNNWSLTDQDLWFKCFENPSHVFRFDGEVLHELVLPHNKDVDAYFDPLNYATSAYHVYTIYRDSNDFIWFGTGAAGPIRYDGKNFNFMIEPDLCEMHNGPANGIRSIIEDAKGNFWFNSKFVYQIQSTLSDSDLPFYTKTKGVGDLDVRTKMEDIEYLSITKDSSGALWIVTYWNGIFKIENNQIMSFPIEVDNQQIHCFYIYCDKENRIWVGTHENGVYTFNGKNFEPASFSN